ncbi:MAG: orotate phosphoribosyltransferase [Cytophagales bacterium]|nr:orotate phosphoribosyltransferase [Cytophagales bacterium]
MSSISSTILCSEEIARAWAEEIISLNAVKFSLKKPFQWSSDRLSPIYCDNRALLSDDRVRRKVLVLLEEVGRKNFPKTEVIAGVATSGIPYASLLADRWEKPLVYVRPTPKSHGLKKAVEGRIKPGQRVLIVEDVISTGGSVLRVAKYLKDEGVQIEGVISLLHYELEEARQLQGAEDLNVLALCTFSILKELACEKGLISGEDADKITEALKFPPEQKIYR